MLWLAVDHTGTRGTVQIAAGLHPHPFSEGVMYGLHRVGVWNGRATLWETSGVEQVDEEDYKPPNDRRGQTEATEQQYSNNHDNDITENVLDKEATVSEENEANALRV